MRVVAIHVRPISLHVRLDFIAQQSQGVAHVVEQHGVVLDHQAQAWVSGNRRAQGAQTIAVGTALFNQAQSNG